MQHRYKQSCLKCLLLSLVSIASIKISAIPRSVPVDCALPRPTSSFQEYVLPLDLECTADQTLDEELLFDTFALAVDEDIKSSEYKFFKKTHPEYYVSIKIQNNIVRVTMKLRECTGCWLVQPELKYPIVNCKSHDLFKFLISNLDL